MEEETAWHFKVLVTHSMASSYRRTFIESKGENVHHKLFKRVFCSWDFAIEQRNASKVQREAFRSQIRVSESKGHS